MTSGLAALERYRELSAAMLESARAQEWEELVRIGTERDALAGQWPADLTARLPASHRAAAKTIIERCQALDAQIRSLTDERQKALRVLLRATSV